MEFVGAIRSQAMSGPSFPFKRMSGVFRGKRELFPHVLMAFR